MRLRLSDTGSGLPAVGALVLVPETFGLGRTARVYCQIEATGKHTWHEGRWECQATATERHDLATVWDGDSGEVASFDCDAIPAKGET